MSLIARLRGSRFLRDSAVLQVAAGANGVAALVGALAIAHVLGPTRQGEYFLAVATWSFLWLLVNMGLYNVAVSQVAAAAARDNEVKVGAWIAWLAKASIAIGLGATVLAWVALPAFARWAYGSPEVGRAAIALAVTPLLEWPRVALGAALQGTRRMAALARVETGQEWTRVFGAVAGALATGTAAGAAIGSVSASAVGSLLAMDAYRSERRAGTAHLPGLADLRARLREVPLTHGLRLGLRVGLMRNVDAYGVQILPPMVLGVFGDPAWVAYLRLAQRFVGVARTLTSGIARTALPHFSGLLGTRELGKLEAAYWRTSLGSGGLMAVVLLGSLPLVPWVLGLFPDAYQDPVWLCYVILLPGVVVLSFSVANPTFYMVTNTLGVAIVLQLLGLLVGTGLVALFAWLWPTVGTAIGLSLGFTWSLVHVAYAARWFRRQRRLGSLRDEPLPG